MARLWSSSPSSNSHHLGHLPLWLLSALRAAKMEGRASGGLLKQLASFVKAKLAAVKGKTSAVKTQLIIFGLLHNRKALMTALSDKIHTLMSSHPEKLQEAVGAAVSDHGGKTVISQHNAPPSMDDQEPPTLTEARCTVESGSSTTTGREIVSTAEDEEDVSYCPDHLMISHSLSFDDEVGGGGGGGTESVSDAVKKYTQRDEQGEFVLEEEIDQVAELFIERFHRQMMLERLESFRRRREGGA